MLNIPRGRGRHSRGTAWCERHCNRSCASFTSVLHILMYVFAVTEKISVCATRQFSLRCINRYMWVPTARAVLGITTRCNNMFGRALCACVVCVVCAAEKRWTRARLFCFCYCSPKDQQMCRLDYYRVYASRHKHHDNITTDAQSVSLECLAAVTTRTYVHTACRTKRIRRHENERVSISRNVNQF